MLEANPNYAVIKDGRGITKTVSTKDLAPAPELIGERINQNTEMVDVNEDCADGPETVVPTDSTYSKLVEAARYKNPKVAIERLAIPNEIICTPKT